MDAETRQGSGSPAGRPDGGSLAGRLALVTGASRGIGRAVALALAAAGADVGLAARSRDDLEVTAEEARAFGVRAAIAELDVTEPESVQAAVDRLVADLGGLDVLVNNSGVVTASRLLDTSVEEWDRVHTTNLRGTFLCCRAAGRYLVEQRSGKVINMASSWGNKAMSGFSAYCSSKAGLIQLTRVLALEWARDNVQVNAIAPGYVVTDLNADLRADRTLETRMVDRVPAKRMATAEEIGPLAVLLASPASDYMTGSVLLVDGGHAL